MMLPRLIRVILISLLCLTCACSSIFIEESQEPPESQESLRPELSQVNPYRLSVIDEYNDGENLYVKLFIKQEEGILPEPVYVIIETYSEIDKLEDKFYNLKDLPDLQDAVVLSIPVSDQVQNYQLKLVWGEQAVSFFNVYLKKLLQFVAIKEAKVQKVKSCKNDSGLADVEPLVQICQIIYNFDLVIENQASQTIPAIDFVIKLFDPLEQTVYENFYKHNLSDFKPQTKQSVQFSLVEPKEFKDLDLRADLEIQY